MKTRIGDKLVGDGSPCFIIAEAGVNHNGSVETAKKLVDAAKDAGADAVKFQTFRAEELATSHVEKAHYQKSSGKAGESQLEMLKKLELSGEDFRQLFRYCRDKGIIFLSTPFDFKSADMLDNLGVPAFKVSSGDLNNYPFLAHLAKKGKPIILSTGMAEMHEIGKAIASIKGEGNDRIIILQCTSAYPAPYAEANLNTIKSIRERFGFLVGLSDHTQGIEVSIAAVALGACAVEKHFTLDKSMPGPDHKASLDVSELKSLVSSIRHVESAMGSGDKKPMPSELATKPLVRKRIVAACDIPKGAVLSRGMLSLKRSSSGPEPSELDRLIGKKAKKAIKKDEPIDLGVLEG